MEITKTSKEDFTLYRFKSRGVYYDVLTTDFKIFDVFSYSGRTKNNPPERFVSLAELGRGNATLKKLSQHIAKEAA